MNQTVTALFDDFTVAQRAVESLADAGFSRSNISLMANDSTKEYSTRLTKADAVTEDVSAGEGAAFGAVTGALIGLGALLIPGIGPVVAAGPLAGALVGAIAGGVTGGVTAGLIDLGVDEETANYYAEGVRRGGTLLTVHTTEARVHEAARILDEHGPTDLTTRVATWREEGWERFDEKAEPYTHPQVEAELHRARTGDPVASESRVRTYATDKPLMTGAGVGAYDAYEPRFRDHFATTYGASGGDFNLYLPAYRYGYQIATDTRYNDYDWDRLEGEARREWELHNEGPWDRFKDAIYHAWHSVRYNL